MPRTETHAEIVSYPSPARPYFTYFMVLSDGTRVYRYSDDKPATKLGIDYAAAKADMAARFGIGKGKS